MNTARHRSPAPLIRGSIGVHAAAALAVATHPAAWPWAIGALAANHALLAGAGLLPRCHLLGPNLTRLPAAAAARGEIALTIDDGPDPEVTPRVLDLLDAAGARACFFCIGTQARQHPALLRQIIARGHAVENHSMHHRRDFSLLGPRRMRGEVEDAQACLADLCGRAPRFFRAVAGLRNPFLEPILARAGLHLASWTRRAYDTRRGDLAFAQARLATPLAAGDILLLHDGHAARTPSGLPLIVALLPLLGAVIGERRLHPVTLATVLAEER